MDVDCIHKHVVGDPHIWSINSKDNTTRFEFIIIISQIIAELSVL